MNRTLITSARSRAECGKRPTAAQNWKPIFDKQHTTSSIGALAVAPSDHNTIYAGAGEAALRGNITYGDGVYKSVDAGRNWRNVGLKDTPPHRRAHRSSREPGHRFRRGRRPRLRAERGARHLPHDRWRKDLDESFVQGREHRRDRRCLRSAQSEHAFRRALAGAAAAVVFLQRRRGQRALSLDRRRNDLAGIEGHTVCPKEFSAASA